MPSLHNKADIAGAVMHPPSWWQEWASFVSLAQDRLLPVGSEHSQVSWPGTAQPSPKGRWCVTATKIIPICRGCFRFQSTFSSPICFSSTISMWDGDYHFHLTDKEMKQRVGGLRVAVARVLRNQTQSCICALVHWICPKRSLVALGQPVSTLLQAVQQG